MTSLERSLIEEWEMAIGRIEPERARAIADRIEEVFGASSDPLPWSDGERECFALFQAGTPLSQVRGKLFHHLLETRPGDPDQE